VAMSLSSAGRWLWDQYFASGAIRDGFIPRTSREDHHPGEFIPFALTSVFAYGLMSRIMLVLRLADVSRSRDKKLDQPSLGHECGRGDN
jgi:hypothetical protein